MTPDFRADVAAAAAAGVVIVDDIDSESLIDGLVGLFRGVIEARKDACYGSLQISDDQRDELARGLVQNLLASHTVSRDADAGKCGNCGADLRECEACGAR